MDEIIVKNVDENKHQTIDRFDLSKYEYQNHTIKKLKTIKELDNLKIELSIDTHVRTY